MTRGRRGVKQQCREVFLDKMASMLVKSKVVCPCAMRRLMILKSKVVVQACLLMIGVVHKVPHTQGALTPPAGRLVFIESA